MIIIMTITIIVIVLVALSMVNRNSSKLNPSTKFYDIIISKASKYRLDPCLIAAVIHTESSFNPNATRYESHLNDSSLGLMQLLLGTANEPYMRPGTTREELFNPEINIDLGCKYIRWLVDNFGINLPDDIDAYNVGPGNFKKGKRNILYVSTVKSNYKRYCK